MSDSVEQTVSKQPFYLALENVFRGNKDLIKKRLQVYLPFLLPLKRYYPDAQVLDLGCGRGEWLNVLKTNGVIAKGVDLNSAMLLSCKNEGLDVEFSDILSYLEQVPSNALLCVSGFHIIEHLEFEQVQKIIFEAHRVLKPGGLLILETPNPENILTACNNFHLDPTHRFPIPGPLLYFLGEYYGYKRVKIFKSSGDVAFEVRGIMDVLNGASPDHALIAQKNADDEILACNAIPFAQNYGRSLVDVCADYDKKLNQLIKNGKLHRIWSRMVKYIKFILKK